MGRLIGAAVALLIAPVLLLSAAAAGILNAGGDAAGAGSGQQPDPGSTALADIPPRMLVLYQRAASVDCDRLPWTVLAAIGKVESDHGRSTRPGVHSGANAAGAQGPMQFLPATFARYARPVPAGGADPPSPYDPADAIHAAARYLCTTGARAGADIPGAVFAYNHSAAYVSAVLTLARGYAAAAPAGASGGAAAAVAFARAQLGVPYVWGGNGPTDGGGGGFDCSGLTRAAYATAGVTIPRTADTQWRHGPAIPAGQPLQPGDLLFYGTPTHAVHVVIYAGDNRVIHAPYQGQPVQYAALWTTGFIGATRPAAHD